MRVLLFGTGKYYQKYKHIFCNVCIVALLDNDLKKIGKKIDSILVVEPQNVTNLKFDKVFILSVHEQEMKMQLIQLGVENSCVFGIHEFYIGLGEFWPNFPVCIYEPARRMKSCGKGRVCIIVWHLTITGGPVAMLGLVKTLINIGYEPKVMAYADGPMKEEFLKAGASVIIDQYLCCKRMDEIYGAGQYEAVWTDAGLVLWMLADSANPDAVIMWFHAGECMYAINPYYTFTRMSVNNVNFYAVGEFPRQAFLRRKPDTEIHTLLYGVDDVVLPCEMNRDKNIESKVVFAIIGSIYELKGQDVFLRAIAQLKEEEKEKAVFRIIGKFGTSPQYNEALLIQIEDLRSNGVVIELLGEQDRDSMVNIYKDIDVLVSASREDAMPIVCVEGAMHCCAIICSDQVGFKTFIQDGKNGYVFKSEEVKELAEIFKKFIDKPEISVTLGKEARKIFEKFFSMEKFNENIKFIMANL